MKSILVIAGSDPSGGAGIQADLATLKDFEVPAVFALTAITAQNEDELLQIHATPADLLTQQLAAATKGKELGAAKIGMIATRTNILALAWFLNQLDLDNVVIDPILHSSSGVPLLESKADLDLRQKLLPMATVITPNLPEAMALVGRKIQAVPGMREAAKEIFEMVYRLKSGTSIKKPFYVLLKGGHLSDRATDILYDGNQFQEFSTDLIPGRSPRGTGCRFSSAIAAGLAKGEEIGPAVQKAKNYVNHYIASARFK